MSLCPKHAYVRFTKSKQHEIVPITRIRHLNAHCDDDFDPVKTYKIKPLPDSVEYVDGEILMLAVDTITIRNRIKNGPRFTYAPAKLRKSASNEPSSLDESKNASTKKNEEMDGSVDSDPDQNIDLTAEDGSHQSDDGSGNKGSDEDSEDDDVEIGRKRQLKNRFLRNARQRLLSEDSDNDDNQGVNNRQENRENGPRTSHDSANPEDIGDNTRENRGGGSLASQNSFNPEDIDNNTRQNRGDGFPVNQNSVNPEGTGENTRKNRDGSSTRRNSVTSEEVVDNPLENGNDRSPTSEASVNSEAAVSEDGEIDNENGQGQNIVGNNPDGNQGNPEPRELNLYNVADNKVYLGEDIYIDEDTWLILKSEQSHSLFVKGLACSIFGIRGLMLGCFSTERLQYRTITGLGTVEKYCPIKYRVLQRCLKDRLVEKQIKGKPKRTIMRKLNHFVSEKRRDEIKRFKKNLSRNA